MDRRLQTYKEIYNSTFKDTVEIKPYGHLDKDRVMRELADYALLIEGASRVYYEITNGAISIPNTIAEAVIAVYHDVVSDIVDEALREEREIIRKQCTCGALTK